MTDHERLRRITRLQFGTKNYVVGEDGVTFIEFQPAFDSSGRSLAQVEYDDGLIKGLIIPREDGIDWDHVDAGPNLVVPNKEIVTP